MTAPLDQNRLNHPTADLPVKTANCAANARL